jgi:tetratricopeptide (TPR) repeat protein
MQMKRMAKGQTLRPLRQWACAMETIGTLSFACMFLASGAQHTQWGNLKPGPYAVGYKTIRATDETRRYFEAARPLQVYVWYPAAAAPAGRHFTYADYFNDAAYDWGPDARQMAYLKQHLLKSFKNGPLNPSFPGGLTDTQFNAILATRLPIARDAPAAAGQFPVLLHLHVNGALTQSLMLEYFASHGYVVLSLSLYGSAPAFYGRGEEGGAALLQLTEDLSFALAQARGLANADVNRAAMIGMLAGAGMSLQLKEMPFAALACMDCSWGEKRLQQMPFYDPKKIRIPVLEMVNTEFADQQKTFLDSLPFAERYKVRFQQFPHADFYPFPKIARPEESAKHRNFELASTITLHFLNAVLKDDPESKTFLAFATDKQMLPSNVLSLTKAPAQKAVPTEGEFLTWLRYGDMGKVRAARKAEGGQMASQQALFGVVLFLCKDNEPHAMEALKMYTAAYAADPRKSMLYQEYGYALLQERQTGKALEVFTLFAQDFPESPYAQVALHNAYGAMGEKEKAKEAARKALELVDRSSLSAAEKERLRNSIRQNH